MARKLRDRGVLFDEDEFERMRVDALGLSIDQTWEVPSTVMDLPGETCYILCAVIRNDSARILSPSRIRFDGPPWEREMVLSKNPKGQRKSPYDITDLLPEYGRYLNHIITRRHIVLLPGESVRGFWVAQGKEILPREYRDRDRFELRITLFDERGRYDQKPFWVTVDRKF